MASLAAQTIYTPEEYLALERKATFKSEYLNGEIFAMSGASLAHTRITLDIATELNIQLRGQECEVITQQQKWSLPESLRYQKENRPDKHLPESFAHRLRQR